MRNLNEMGMTFTSNSLSFPQAALGDEIEVPTVHGKFELKIPAGTQIWYKIPFKGKGIKNVHGHGTGDQHVIVKYYTEEND